MYDDICQVYDDFTRNYYRGLRKLLSTKQFVKPERNVNTIVYNVYDMILFHNKEWQFYLTNRNLILRINLGLGSLLWMRIFLDIFVGIIFQLGASG